MMNIRTIYIAIVAAASALSLASCVKDELFNTPHPDRGVVVVQADFSQRSTACPCPADYTLIVGSESCTAPAEQPYCHPGKFLPGSYALTAYNVCSKMTVKNGIIKVNTVSANLIEPMPGYLFTARQEITVIKDDTLRVSLPMAQRTRDLRFELTVTGAGPELIGRITGRLDGVAGKFDLAAQQASDELFAVAPAFTRTGDKVTAEVRLLGVVGAKQTLTLDIAFTDGRTQTVESDLSALLADFAAGDMTAMLVVTGNLLTPVGSGFSATVTDWEIGEREDVGIN